MFESTEFNMMFNESNDEKFGLFDTLDDDFLPSNSFKQFSSTIFEPLGADDSSELKFEPNSPELKIPSKKNQKAEIQNKAENAVFSEEEHNTDADASSGNKQAKDDSVSIELSIGSKRLDMASPITDHSFPKINRKSRMSNSSKRNAKELKTKLQKKIVEKMTNMRIKDKQDGLKLIQSVIRGELLSGLNPVSSSISAKDIYRKFGKKDHRASYLCTFPVSFIDQVKIDKSKASHGSNCDKMGSFELAKLFEKSKNSNMNAGYYTACLSKTLSLLKEELRD